MRVRASCWTRCSAPADEESKFENAPDGGVFYVFSVPPSCRGGVPSPPGRWVSGTRRFVLLGFTLCCCSTPFLWSCPKKRGGAPKKNAWGGGAPVRFRGPPASPTRVGGATRPLRCPLRGRIESLAPGARGLGWQKSRPVKVFCPAFLQKSGRGPGAEPMAACRSARNSPCANEAQEGVKGGTLAGGSPFAGGLSRPQPVRRQVIRRRSWVEPRPYEGLE